MVLVAEHMNIASSSPCQA